MAVHGHNAGGQAIERARQAINLDVRLQFAEQVRMHGGEGGRAVQPCFFAAEPGEKQVILRLDLQVVEHSENFKQNDRAAAIVQGAGGIWAVDMG